MAETQEGTVNPTSQQPKQEEEEPQQPQIPASALIPSKKGPGILMRTLKRGRGDRFPKKGENCLIHFEGYVEGGENDTNTNATHCGDNNMKRIASTRDLLQLTRGFQFQLGKHEIIEGIEVAVSNMIVGQIAEITIPSLYGYGHQGFPPHIPPRATLIFHIELVDIVIDVDDDSDTNNGAENNNHNKSSTVSTTTTTSTTVPPAT